jgi:hypothetical protein
MPGSPGSSRRGRLPSERVLPGSWPVRMANTPDLAAVVAAAAARQGLRRRDDLGQAGWTFWELRNINMHRVVGLLDGDRTFADVRELEEEIRTVISSNFRRAWWRGLACGVIAEVVAVWPPDDLARLIDIRENRKGVLQFVVLADNERRRAIGAHTWETVYLSPVYRDTIRALAEDGYQVATAVRGKDGLMRLLTGVGELQGASFPEYHDPP